MIRVDPKFDKRWMYTECVDRLRQERRHKLATIEAELKKELPSVYHAFHAVLEAAEKSYDAPKEIGDGLTFDEPANIGSAYGEIILGHECKPDVIAYFTERAKGKKLGDRANRLWRIDRTARAIKSEQAAREALKYIRVTHVTVTDEELDGLNARLDG